MNEVAPWTMVAMTRDSPPTNDTGLNCVTRSAGDMPSWAPQCSALTTVHLCENTTPFGVPALPDVKSTYPGSSASNTGIGHSRSERRTSSSTSSSTPGAAARAWSRCRASVTMSPARLACSIIANRSTGSRPSSGTPMRSVENTPNSADTGAAP
jgi:hypothetical protein